MTKLSRFTASIAAASLISGIAVVAVSSAATQAGASTVPSGRQGPMTVAFADVSLQPAVLPPGVEVGAEETDVVSDGAGGQQSYRTQRFRLPDHAGLLMVEMASGPGVSAAVPASTTAPVVDVAGGQARYIDTGLVEELRWRLDDTTVLSVLGSGSASTVDLYAAASSLTPSLLPGPIAAADLVGLQDVVDLTGRPQEDKLDNNMRGTSGSRYTDDWGQDDGVNVTICEDCYPARGNVVGVWQAILWADHMYYIDYNANYMTNCDVDGRFGAKTREVTRTWQDAFGHRANYPPLTVDGVVGPRTWAAADDALRLTSGNVIAYVGSYHNLYFKRVGYYNGAELNYSWDWNFSGYRYTGFSAISMNRVTSNCST